VLGFGVLDVYRPLPLKTQNPPTFAHKVCKILLRSSFTVLVAALAVACGDSMS